MSYSAIEQLVTSEAYKNPEFRDPAWNTTPLERQDFLIAMQSIVHQIGNKLLNYHLVSDETSARIPTLILAGVQRRMEQKAKRHNGDNTDQIKRSELELLSHPRIDFLIGTTGYPMSAKVSYIEKNADRLRQKRILYVTEIVESGVSLNSMLGIFDTFDIGCDAAIVTLQGALDEQLAIDTQHQFYLGDRYGVAGTAVWQSNNWTGIEKPSRDTHAFAISQAYPVLQNPQYRQNILCVHRQIQQFAEFLVP